jgi:hypothetical protein
MLFETNVDLCNMQLRVWWETAALICSSPGFDTPSGGEWKHKMDIFHQKT